MRNKPKKNFLTSHSKSSAMVVSLAVHAVLAVIALSFVAVTVITKDDQNFESKQVVRPRMPPKKLQVPVKIKKKQRKPKLRQRIVVKHQINRNMPDIKMPEISGIKGGLGAAGGAGLGEAGGIGFSMPEIEVFGVRSRGEKVFLALDSDAIIMRDEVGGMLAYTIIKDELEKIIGGLSPTTLFNLSVFDHHSASVLFPRMVPATKENTIRVGKWLDSLNKVSKGMSNRAYGVKTLGKGGTQLPMTGELARGKLQKDGIKGREFWYRPAAEAMMQQADTVFILSGWWGVMRHAVGERPSWPEAKRKRWEKRVQEAQVMHKEENKKRAAKGEAPQVIRDKYHLIKEYFGEDNLRAWMRPEPEWYNYTGKDYAKALHVLREEYLSKLPAKSGLTNRNKDRFSLNVVYFVPSDHSGTQSNFKDLTRRCNGDLRIIQGLESIQSSVSGFVGD